MTNTTYTIQRRHFHWGILIMLFVVGSLVVATTYLAGGWVRVENGKAVITEPSLGTLREQLQERVMIQDPVTGEKVTTTREPMPAQPVLPKVAQPNGKTTSDDLGPDGKLQRNETLRYDPIDRLTTAVADTNKNVAAIGDSVKKVADSVDALNQKLTDSTGSLQKQVALANNNISTLGGKVNDLTGTVDVQNSSVSDLTTRVAKLETAVPLASAPQSAPQATATPASQLAPAQAAPQAPAPVPANVSQVTPAPDTVSKPNQVADGPRPYYVPPGFHLNAGMGNEKNLAKINSCQGRIVPDYNSPRCVPAGYRDPQTGKVVMRCPNKCV